MQHPAPGLLENVLDVMSDHVYMLRLEDDGGFTIVYANQALSGFMERRRSELQGRRLDEILKDPDLYRRVCARYLEVARLCLAQHFEETTEGFGHDRIEYFDTRLAPVLGEHGHCTHVCGISRNITRRREAENALRRTNEELAVRLREIEILQAQLRQQAIRDPLTGLFNRRYLQESLKRELARAHRENYPVSLMMLDVDYFKPFNDAFGHQAGDTALMALAQHLSINTRAEDVICRFGGEEFIILMPHSSVEQAAERIHNWNDPPFSVSVLDPEGHSVDIGYSVGLSQFPTHCSSSEGLIRMADHALYEAKRRGRRRAVIAPSPC